MSTITNPVPSALTVPEPATPGDLPVDLGAEAVRTQIHNASSPRDSHTPAHARVTSQLASADCQVRYTGAAMCAAEDSSGTGTGGSRE